MPSKPVAFKTESASTIDLFKKSPNLNLNNNNNNNQSSTTLSSSSGKKWFDILASSTDDEEKSVSKFHSLQAENSINHDQTITDNENDMSTTSSTTSFLNSLVQGPLNKSSLHSVSPSVLIDTSFGSIKSQGKKMNLSKTFSL